MIEKVITNLELIEALKKLLQGSELSRQEAHAIIMLVCQNIKREDRMIDIEEPIK